MKMIIDPIKYHLYDYEWHPIYRNGKTFKVNEWECITPELHRLNVAYFNRENKPAHVYIQVKATGDKAIVLLFEQYHYYGVLNPEEKHTEEFLLNVVLQVYVSWLNGSLTKDRSLY